MTVALAPVKNTDAEPPNRAVAAHAAALAPLSPPQRLAYLSRAIDGPIVFTHGFGIEGQVIFHWICERDLAIDVATLDTGRLFPETYALWAETERRYGRRIRAVYPNHATLESMVGKHGIDGFYRSKEARLACCDVRKTRPLGRALAGARVWITGLRGDQSSLRRDAGLISFDDERGLLKVNPVFDWTREALMAVVEAERIPINPLHAKGFASVGCAPCTRATRPGEDERRGRWWWEEDGQRECGLHLRPRAPSGEEGAPQRCFGPGIPAAAYPRAGADG